MSIESKFLQDIKEILDTNSVDDSTKIKELNSFNKDQLIQYCESIKMDNFKSLNKGPLIDKLISVTKKDPKEELIKFISNKENRQKVLAIATQFRSMYGRSWFTPKQAFKAINSMQARSVQSIEEQISKESDPDKLRSLREKLDSITVESANDYEKRLATVNMFGVLKTKKFKGQLHYRVRQDKIERMQEQLDKENKATEQSK